MTIKSSPSPADVTTSPEAWLLPYDRAPRRGVAVPSVVALGGDGIGPEIVRAATRCLRATGAALTIVEPLHGLAAVREKGNAFPDETRAALDGADAILFGAVDTGPEGHCRPILRHLRFGLDTYANVRPAVTLPHVPSTTGDGNVDLIVVRELSEGMYPGCEGDLAELGARWPELRDAIGRSLPGAGAFALQIVTEPATRRVARYAAALAARRRQLGIAEGIVTIVCKDNVLRRSDGLFRRICEQEIAALAGEGIRGQHLYVDEAARQLAANPGQFDVILTSNLYGDIISDVASEVMGGIPMAPSASVGAGCAYFEPCHGSAPTLTGKNLANPTATILSAAMLLGYLGLGADARRMTAAVLDTIGAGTRTADLGGSATTESFTDEVCRRLDGAGSP